MSRAAEQNRVVESAQNEVILQIATDKPAYRPGEAVVINVTALNTTDVPIQMRDLDSSVVTFWFGRTDEVRRLQRFPVVSRKEEAEIRAQGAPAITLEPGEKRARSFLLTRMTEQPGAYVGQVHMEPYLRLDAPNRSGKLYSGLVEYAVHGSSLLRRDNRGILMKEEAIRIVTDEQKMLVLQSDAILIEDEVGFLKWWVNLALRDAEGQPMLKSWLVDPYLGRIWSEAQPFDESMRSPQERPPSPAPIPPPARLTPPPVPPEAATNPRH